MRLGIKFSSLVVLAAFCLAPAAFGSAPIAQKAIAGNGVLNVPAILLSFGGGHGDHDRGDQWGGGGNGCSGGQGGQGGGWGWNGDGWGGGGNGGGNGGCTSVPEGGTSLAYLLLAGACCSGAMVVRSRRQTIVDDAG